MDQQQNEVKATPAVPVKSGLATAALVLGIIGICLSFIPIVNNAAFVLGILASVFGIVVLIKKRCLGKAIASIVLGVLSIVITLAMQAAALKAIDDAFGELDDELGYMSGEKTDEILENHLNVQIGSFQVMEGDYWDESKLEVTLKNKSDQKASFSVTIEAVDSTGARIATDTVYANDLGAGQSQKFEAFTLVSSDDYTALKKATFRVVDASMY